VRTQPEETASTDSTGAAPRDGVRDIGAISAERLLPQVLLAFAPLHKRAFGIATGTAAGLVMALLTVLTLVSPMAKEFPLHLVGQYFAGYTVSWWGVITGGLWGFGVGFTAGWFVAFCRNLVLAISFFAIRTRAEMAQTRDFLDHI